MSILPRLAALALGAALLTSSAAALTPAVSAPSPAALAVDLTSEYRRFSAAAAQYGLSAGERSVLWDRGDEALLTQLETGGISAAELTWLTLPHHRADRAGRYAAWAEAHPDRTAEQVVTAVNMDCDLAFYKDIRPVSDPQSLLVLVNKHYTLASDFVPQLEVLGSAYGRGSLQPEAAAQFRAMADAARADGVTLRSVSAYRSYATQRYTYNGYLAQYSQGVVDDFSARPGHSEHQTGLALDINVARTSAHFENTEAYAWLQEHCARYGFILRYPQGKSHITGYRFEPWHYRYVGTAAAAICMEQGLTYEEYTARLPLGQSPALIWQGRFLSACTPLMLEGQTYLPAGSFARAIGLETEDAGSTVTVTRSGGGVVVLSPSLRAQVNGVPVRLTARAVLLEEGLYLSPADLAALLGLEAVSTPFGLEFSPA